MKSDSLENALINTSEGVARLTQVLKNAGRVVVDTEADSMHHYFEKVCLIQVGFSGQCYLIDPLAGVPLNEFFEVLSTKDLIIHAADNDLRLLKRDFGFQPKGRLFDTMLASQLLGYEKIGLAALVEKFFGVVLSKSSQRADWSIRPLTEKMMIYAANDIQYLERIADFQQKELEALGREDWHREWCERLVKMIDAPRKVEANPKDEWRVKGSSVLQPNELVFVRELWKWRDAEARRKDRPAFMILMNEYIVEAAQWRAKNPGAPLEKGPNALQRFKGEVRAGLENALKTAEQMPQSEWPVYREKTPWYEKRGERVDIEPLADACKKVASELKIQSSVLATAAALTAVMENKPQSIEEMVKTAGLMRWQAEFVLPQFQKIRGGKS